MDFDIIDTAPEHKSGIAYTPRDGFDDLRATFEEFKSANDQRLGALERKRGDVLLEEKVDRINAALDLQTKRMDEMALRHARPALEGRGKLVTDTAAREQKSAFDAYVRSGEAGALRALETKAMSVGSNADGGYLVPVELEHEISGSVYKKPFMTAGPATGWVGETDSRTQTTSPTLDALSFPAMELYAMPAATATLLDDAAVNIDEWIASEVELTFAVQEGAAFVNGDGSNKPKGFLASDTVASASWVWGKLGYVASGGASGFAASNPSDALVDLVYALKAGYRQNGAFVMNRKTQALIRKFKDTGGGYLWQPPAQAGGRASLMTFPLVEAEDMPDVAANSLSIAFGDFRRGYLIVDRLGVRVLRDPYSAKPYVLFYTTKRVGGGVQDFDAIKLMKFAAS
ncbi:MAG: phage major capsid protein [Xanthobacteraceae bacterium]